MKPTSTLRAAIVPLILLAAGCASTPAQRIASSDTYETYPAEIREKIRNGEVDVGFTPDMVRLALGNPDRVTRRQSTAGEAEVWSYDDRKPRISIGLGVGSWSGRSSTSAGVMVGGRDWSDGAWIRVIFKEGKVTAVETRKT